MTIRNVLCYARLLELKTRYDPLNLFRCNQNITPKLPDRVQTASTANSLTSNIATATATGVPLPPLRTLLTFHREGTVVESRRLYLPVSPLGPLLATPGHGEWVRTANGEFAATTLLFYQGAPGAPTADGTEKVRFQLILSPDGKRFAGNVLVEIRDSAGAVVFSGPGVIEGSRIAVEPLP
jgi:hypothetical protein